LTQSSKITGKYVLGYCNLTYLEQGGLHVSAAKSFNVNTLTVSVPEVKQESDRSVDSL
jgi:hypothetical protein